MEAVGFVSIYPTEDGVVHVRFFQEQVVSSHVVLLCSLDECSSIETKAAPRTLVAIKRKLNRVVLDHYYERSGPPLQA